MHVVTSTPLRSAATNERVVCELEAAMPRDASGKIPGSPHLDFEAWKDLIRTMGGRFNPEGIEPNDYRLCAPP
jgi:hypothetical protein